MGSAERPQVEIGLAFVGEMRPLTYEDDSAFATQLAQHCRGCGPGEARAHDDMSLQLQSST
jgi:hypothetical protein